MKRFIFFLPFLFLHLHAIEFDTLQSIPFNDVHFTQGTCENQEVIICCHGYGGDWRLAKHLPSVVPYHIISFNFPDHGIQALTKDPETLCFGTIDELAPLIEIMRRCVIEGGVESLHLYGFSAGGGAVVNALAVLNTNRYRALSVAESRQILKAVEKGSIILDCPLKSVEEIISDRGASGRLVTVQKKYKNNQLIPLESLKNLNPLSLSVILHFQKPDHTLTNRDDALYLEQLQQANQNGKTVFIQGSEGEHSPCLPPLQKEYQRHFSKEFKIL